jgi:hypothetical protein
MPGHQLGRSVYQYNDVIAAMQRVQQAMPRYRQAGHDLTSQLRVLAGLKQHIESCSVKDPRTGAIIQYAHLNAFELELHEAQILDWALGPNL